MIPWILLLVLIAMVALLILWPLAKKPSLLPEHNEEDLSDLGRLRRESSVLFQTLKDMDEEIERGNLDIQDHLVTRADYVRQAALLLREIEGREKILDEEIAQALNRLKANPSEEFRSLSEREEQGGG